MKIPTITIRKHFPELKGADYETMMDYLFADPEALLHNCEISIDVDQGFFSQRIAPTQEDFHRQVEALVRWAWAETHRRTE